MTYAKPLQRIVTQSAREMADGIRRRETTAVELVTAHLERVQEVNKDLNAAVEVLEEGALRAAAEADRRLKAGEQLGALGGVPVSIKDSIDVAGARCTAGTLGRRNAAVATEDATVVKRLRRAGAIPIAKTNLPDLLFAYESDNLIYGRTSNPYDLTRTSGGSSGGESALIAACGSPLGLGSDAAGSVRAPAAFCGICSIKPTSGRLPRTGHLPSAGGWIEALWQIGPMARRTEDLVLAMELLAGEDSRDFTSPPVPLLRTEPAALRIAAFTHNGFAKCAPDVIAAVESSAEWMRGEGIQVMNERPPGIEEAYELEMALLGADGATGIDAYLSSVGSHRLHPLLTAWLDRLRPLRTDVSGFATLWARWDAYRAKLRAFFSRYDAILCPVYTQAALRHGESMAQPNFEGFSYTMAWNVAGAPAATVRVSEARGLPINVQIVTAPWRDMLALEICTLLEQGFGGWQPPDM